MKIRLLFSAALLFGVQFIYSQNVKKLQENNGFKKYKLGSKYQPVYGVKVKQDDKSDKVVIPYMNEKIGEIPVSKIELIYVNDTLSRIFVFSEPYQHTPLLDACKSFFGSPTKDLSDNEATRKQENNGKTSNHYTDRYLWQAQKLSLEYFYQYPKIEGSSNAIKELRLCYTLNDFAKRLERAKLKKYKPGDF